MSSTVLFQIQSFLILTLMIVGVINRKNRNLHVKIMASSILWDLLLILQIEVTRGAIKKASQIITNPLMLKIHLFFAIGSVLLYFVMGFTGRKLLKGENQIRAKHRLFGRMTLVFRILTFVTSFWAVSK